MKSVYPLLESAQSLSDGVGNVDLVEHFASHSVDLDDSRGNADRRRVRRNLAEHHGACRDTGIVAYLERTENLRARADEDVVAQCRVTLACFFTGTAEGDVLVNRAVVADNGCFADNDAHAVVDKHTLADLCGGVDFNSCFMPAALRDPARDEGMSVFQKPVRASV